MSITVTKTFKVDGTPTDVTSFTIGVLRADTGAVVVAAATAMDHDGTGIYSYSWEEPTSGISYTVTFTVVYGGDTTTWEETVEGSSSDTIPLPVLTGDNLVDTFNSLIVERLRVSRAGPKISYQVHGHRVDWNQYLKYLDERILQLRKEIAAATPVEEIGMIY